MPKPLHTQNTAIQDQSTKDSRMKLKSCGKVLIGVKSGLQRSTAAMINTTAQELYICHHFMQFLMSQLI